MEGANHELSNEERERIGRLVQQFLPPGFDREFIADTIIVQAWEKGVPHISREHVRHVCIDAWRKSERERLGRERLTEINKVLNRFQQPASDEVDDKELIEQVLKGCLFPTERKLIWMKYWDGQTLEEIAENTGLTRNQVQQRLKVAIYKMQIEVS
jgi:RNA polymerase sigma factor (sigma-70 family)